MYKKVTYPGDRICYKNIRYEIVKIRFDETDEETIIDFLHGGSSEDEIGLSMNSRCDRDRYDHIWDHFIPKIERVRRIIKQYEKL